MSSYFIASVVNRVKNKLISPHTTERIVESTKNYFIVVTLILIVPTFILVQSAKTDRRVKVEVPTDLVGSWSRRNQRNYAKLPVMKKKSSNSGCAWVEFKDLVGRMLGTKSGWLRLAVRARVAQLESSKLPYCGVLVSSCVLRNSRFGKVPNITDVIECEFLNRFGTHIVIIQINRVWLDVVKDVFIRIVTVRHRVFSRTQGGKMFFWET